MAGRAVHVVIVLWPHSVFVFCFIFAGGHGVEEKQTRKWLAVQFMW